MVLAAPGQGVDAFSNGSQQSNAMGANLLSAASTAAQNAINKVTEWFSQLPGKVWTHLVNTITKVTQFAADLASKASSAAQGFVNNIVNGLSGLPSQMATIGSNIVTGIWNGISSGWNWLKDKVSSLAGSLLNSAKSALGIHSPSKAFRDEFGRWLMPGTIEGVKQSMPKALREMEAQAGELLAAMQGTVDASMNEVSLNASSFGNVLRDQKHGATMETSSDTIIDAFKQALKEMNGGSEKIELTTMFDSDILEKKLIEIDRKHRKRTGKPLLT